MQNNICMICRQHDNYRDKLNRIEQFIRTHNVKPNIDNIQNIHYQWFHHQHCQYGISCPKINRMNIDNDHTARQLEPFITSIASSGDSKMVHELLQLLRGDYPAVYHTVETLYHKSKKG